MTKKKVIKKKRKIKPDKTLSRLVKFGEKAKGLEIREKVKLVLFLVGIKKNAEVVLKIGGKNLGEKFEFEKLLKLGKVVFSVSKPRSYEEIKKIKGNKVVWEIEGTYFIYDLFKDRRSQEIFKQYLELLDKEKYDAGDRTAGKHYGYPKSCVEKLIKERKTKFLKRKYSYWEYYKKQQDLDRKFPFVFHRPCSLDCKESIRLNKEHGEALRKGSRKVYKEYVGKSRFKGELIVGGISDVEINGKSIWPKKSGYEYELIFRKRFRKHFYLVSFLSRKKYVRGQVLKGEVVLQYDYAKVRILKEKRRTIGGLHHERKLPLLGEVTIG